MNKRSFLLIALLITITLSCKDDDDPTIVSENPLNSYLLVAGFSEVENFIDDGFFEFGIKFTPKVNGQINSIVVKLPDDQTDLRITIWDGVSKTVLQTITIPMVKANTELTHAITPFNVTKNDAYMITLNSDDYYYRARPDESDVSYPITIGNLEINGYGYSEGSAQTYPYSFHSYYYAGDLSFVFTPTVQ